MHHRRGIIFPAPFFRTAIMSSFVLIVIVAAAAVGILVLGMSLTLIFKGHHIRSEIGENPDMKRLGIRCTADEMRRAEMRAGGECGGAAGCEGCGMGCASGEQDDNRPKINC